MHKVKAKVKNSQNQGKIQMTDKIKIFLGDDDFVNRHINEEHIKKFGFSVTTFASGKDLITALYNDVPDLVLIDCYMPEMSGYEAAEYILNLKAENKLPKSLPIIAISGDNSKRNYNRIKTSGFDDLIEKPLDDAKFIKLINKYLNIDLTKNKLTEEETIINENINSEFFAQLERYSEEIPKILKNKDNFNQAGLTKLSNIIHNCIGTPGVFGFHEISNLSIVLNEEIFKVIAKDEISEIEINKIDNIATILLEEIKVILKNKAQNKKNIIFKTQNNSFALNILLIEDDYVLNNLITQKLELNKHRVINLNSGEKLNQVLEKENLDIIIIDLLLPDLNSENLIKQLQISKKHKNTPIIVITSDQTNKKMIDTINLGVSDFIQKPFEITDLLKRVESTAKKNKTKILVVDDDELILTLLKDKLEQKGHEVITNSDNNNTLRLVQDVKPDIIILDRVMPNINGNNMLKILKNRSDTKNIPIIFLTVVNNENDILEAYKEGVSAYISKPFEISTLNRTILDILEKPNS